MVVAGANHFLTEDFYLRMMPPWLPAHHALIVVSGVFEILGGIGVLVPRTRRLAGWGLVALFVAVFPANFYVAVEGIDLMPGTHFPLGNWLRLPLQLVLIAWAVAVARQKSP